MKQFALSLTIVTVLGFLMSRAAGQDAGAPIAPFINQRTFAVVRLDPEGIDYDALDRWADQAFAQSHLDNFDRKGFMEDLRRRTREGRGWRSEFQKAGGTSFWAVFTTEDFPMTFGFIVVPLAPHADASALKKLWPDPGRCGAVLQLHGDLLIDAGPSPSTDWLKQIRPAPRPDLAKALAAVGEGSVQIALIPNEDARKVVESMVPPPATDLLRDIVWAAVAIKTPPNLSARIVVQSPDHESAVLQKLLEHYAEPAVGADKPPAAAEYVKRLLAVAADVAAHAHVQGDRLVADLDPQQATVVAARLGDLFYARQERSECVMSQSRLRQLFLACEIYANNHKGEFPATLEEAVTAADANPILLINPRDPARKPGFIYVKPPRLVKYPEIRLIIYENFQAFDGGVDVEFADGHAVLDTNEARFKKLLQDAQRERADRKANPGPATSR